MSHVLTQPMPPLECEGGRLRLHLVPAARDNLIWVLETASHKAIVLDGPEASGVIDLLAREKLELAALLTTHTHGDHTGLHRDLARAGLLDRIDVYGARMSKAAIPGVTHLLTDGAAFEVEGCTFDAMRTDGHLTAHLCYRTAGLLFTGDTLFWGGCGRVFDGPFEAMAHSLWRLAGLPADLLVCCAHEYTLDNLRFAVAVEPDNAELQTRLAHVEHLTAHGVVAGPTPLSVEQATNPFLRPGSPRIHERLSELAPDATLESHEAVFTALRKLKDRGVHRTTPPA